MKKILFLLAALAINISLFSHPWKPKHYVIVDTDGGIDDLRAITMLLASPDVRVLGIIVSPGALNSGSAYLKVKSLLNSFYHEGLPVGINKNCSFVSPDFKVAMNTSWGVEKRLDIKNAPDAISLIKEILSAEKSRISFLCLGGMSTASSALIEIPALSQQVKEIIWSCELPATKERFNYSIDRPAAEKILNGAVPVKIVSGLGEVTFFNDELIREISQLTTLYSGKISKFFTSESSVGHSYSFRGNDEMIPLYLHYPSLFQADRDKTGFSCPQQNISALRDSTLVILAGETVARNQVIKNIPVDPSFYFADIEPSVTSIIQRYGMDEWISGVIANELHRHLGVFAIVGVKMGIRAREFFNTGIDEFTAVSHAGSVPPLSCMNDGIQVSTGATPGHGLLTVINESPPAPSVDFTYMNHKIKLTLKPEIADKISSELKEINFIHGLDSDIYWELVRKNSIKYWLNLDRHEIFDIEILK